jgi:hypothetical protein
LDSQSEEQASTKSEKFGWRYWVQAIWRQCAEVDSQADDEGNAMAPPRLQKFVGAEEAPPLPETV